MTDKHTRHAGHGHAGHVIAGRGQRRLVPDRGQRLRQVRVAREQRAAARHLGAVHRPRVAVRELVDKPGGELAELAEQRARRLGFRAADSRITATGSRPWHGPQRSQRKFLVRAGVEGRLRVLRDDGEPVHGPLRAERVLKQGVVQRGGGEGQFLGELALDDEGIHRRPRGRVHAGQRERGRPLAAGPDLRDVVVHAARVGEQRLGDRAGLRRLRPFGVGGAHQPELQLELVRGKVG